jgi:hypothetical protein
MNATTCSTVFPWNGERQSFAIGDIVASSPFLGALDQSSASQKENSRIVS